MRKEQWQPMRCHKVRHRARPILRAVGEPLGAAPALARTEQRSKHSHRCCLRELW